MASHPNAIVERDINYIKDNPCFTGRRTQDENTHYTDFILTGIKRLNSIVLADKIDHYKLPSKSKPSHIIRLSNSIKPNAYSTRLRCSFTYI